MENTVWDGREPSSKPLGVWPPFRHTRLSSSQYNPVQVSLSFSSFPNSCPAQYRCPCPCTAQYRCSNPCPAFPVQYRPVHPSLSSFQLSQSQYSPVQVSQSQYSFPSPSTSQQSSPSPCRDLQSQSYLGTCWCSRWDVPLDFLGDNSSFPCPRIQPPLRDCCCFKLTKKNPNPKQYRKYEYENITGRLKL